MRLRQRLNEEHRKCEKMLHENAALRDQLEESHQMKDALTSELQETTHKLKEAENSSETLRKELTDVRRQLDDSSYEKEKYNSSNKELRDYVERIEREKKEQWRSLEVAYKRIYTLEDAKTGLEVEQSCLQAHVRDLERQQLQTSHQLQSVHEELQRSHASNAQIQNEEKELHQLKKQIVELDESLDVSRQELSRMRSHGEDDEELLVRLEDSRGRESKLEIKNDLNVKSINKERPTDDKRPNKYDLDYWKIRPPPKRKSGLSMPEINREEDLAAY
jgi:rootletin